MKLPFILCILVSITHFCFAQIPNDSTLLVSPDKVYDENLAFYSPAGWVTTRTNLAGIRWKESAPLFQVSPEGKALFEQSMQSRKVGGKLMLYGGAGLLATFGAAVAVGKSNPSNAAVAGVVLGMIGSTAAFTVGSIKMNKARNTFESALWLRNRDALAVGFPVSEQTHFKRYYENETLFMNQQGLVSKGKAYRYALLGGNNNWIPFFENSPEGFEKFKKYQNKTRVSNALGVVGTAAYLWILLAGQQNNIRARNNLLGIGGSAYFGLVGGLAGAAQNDLRQAVYIRNREVIGSFNKQKKNYLD